MEISRKSRYRIGLLLLACFLLATVMPVAAQEMTGDGGCRRCHQSMVDAVMRSRFVHQPFLAKPCVTCHGAVAGVAMAAVTARPLPVSRELEMAQQKLTTREQEKIKWFEESPTPARRHCFLIRSMAAGDVLYVEVRDEGSSQRRLRRFTLPARAGLPPLADSGVAPVISDVHVLAVRRGLLLSAVIGWHTDGPADATVRYGLDVALRQNVSQAGSFIHDHQVTLTGLKANQTYRFCVVSSDLAGRRTVSPMATFSTGRDQSRAPEDMPAGDGKFVVQSNFFKYGDSYVLQMSFSRPATVYLGTPLVRSEQVVSGQPVARPETAGGERRTEEAHPPLNSAFESQIKVCVTCHPDSTSELSHPVNVLPPAGMRVPPEYPTLADGRITCMTCHVPHGGEYQYRLRKARKRDLCIGCHLDMA